MTSTSDLDGEKGATAIMITETDSTSLGWLQGNERKLSTSTYSPSLSRWRSLGACQAQQHEQQQRPLPPRHAGLAASRPCLRAAALRRGRERERVRVRVCVCVRTYSVLYIVMRI